MASTWKDLAGHMRVREEDVNPQASVFSHQSEVFYIQWTRHNVPLCPQTASLHLLPCRQRVSHVASGYAYLCWPLTLYVLTLSIGHSRNEVTFEMMLKRGCTFVYAPSCSLGETPCAVFGVALGILAAVPCSPQSSVLEDWILVPEWVFRVDGQRAVSRYNYSSGRHSSYAFACNRPGGKGRAKLRLQSWPKRWKKTNVLHC